VTYAGHGLGAPEASADTRVDTLGLAPAGVDTHEPVTLVTGEALGACGSLVSTSLRMGRAPIPSFRRLEQVRGLVTWEFAEIFVFRSSGGRGVWRVAAVMRKNVRFLTIGTCFLAATILTVVLCG